VRVGDASGAEEADSERCHLRSSCAAFYASARGSGNGTILAGGATILTSLRRRGAYRLGMAVAHLSLTPGPPRAGAIDDLRIVNVGHYPRRLAPGTDWAHPQNAIVFIVAGSGTFRAAAGAAQPVGPGSMWTIVPGMRYAYSPAPGGWWEEFFITFDGPGVERWYRRGWLEREQRVHRLAPIGPLVAAIGALVRTMQEGTPAASDRGVLMAERLLFEMRQSRGDERSEADAQDGAIAAAISHLHQHLAEEVDLERLARRLGLSYTSLRRGIHAATGEPPARCLRRLRCETAKKLLAETALPIGEIARQVGIPATVVFTRIFKRYAGMTPTRWRETATK
jgi:AraC-like DNA-binding protein